MRCTHCRREIPKDAFFCPYCGLVVGKNKNPGAENEGGCEEKTLIYGEDLSKGKPSGKPWEKSGKSAQSQKPQRIRVPEDHVNEEEKFKTAVTEEELERQLKELGRDWDEEHNIADSQEWETGEVTEDSQEWETGEVTEDSQEWDDEDDWTDGHDRPRSKEWARKQNIVERRERNTDSPGKKKKRHLVLIGVVVLVMLLLIIVIWLIFSTMDAREQRASVNSQEELENQEKDITASEEDENDETDGETTEDIEMSFVSEPEDMGDYYRLSVSEASASSEISQEGTDNSAGKIVDGNERTSWQEGVDGDGIGESVQLKLAKPYKVRYLSFQLGNWNSERYYAGNNRPKELEITVGNVTQTVTFPDGQTEYWLELSRECPAQEITLTVQSVYSGSEWDDTCIAEVGIYGVNDSQ